MRANRHDEANELYREILSTCPESPEALFRLGVLEFMISDYEGAAHHFSESLRHDRMNADAWQRLGRTRLKQKRFKEAARAFRESFQIQPDMSVKLKEGSFELASGDTNAAKRVFETMIMEDPLQHGALYFLGNIHRAEGETDKAAGLYEAAIEAHPSLVEAYVNLASIRYSQGPRYDEAASLLEKTLVEVPFSAPYDPMVRLNLGLCYVELKNYEKAMGHFEAFLKLSPEGEKAEKVRAILEGSQGFGGVNAKGCAGRIDDGKRLESTRLRLSISNRDLDSTVTVLCSVACTLGCGPSSPDAVFRGDVAHTARATGPKIAGELVWKKQLNGWIVSTPAISRGRLFIGDAGKSIRALDTSTGDEIWKYDTEGAIMASSLVMDGLVMTGSVDKSFYALKETTGDLAWSFPTEGEINSSAVTDGKRVFFGSWDGSLYALIAKTGKEAWRFKTGTGSLPHRPFTRERFIAGPGTAGSTA